jgi:hypothetical protein
MSYRRFIPVLTLLLLFGISLRVSVDTDSWWHLAAGRWMQENGTLLDHDVFTHSVEGKAWTNPNWLSQVLLFRVYSVTGLGGLNLLTALLACLGLMVLWPVLQGPPLFKAFVLVLAAIAAAIFWAARPHMFSFALTGAYVHILERWSQSRNRMIWFLPVLMALWVNLHGGFAIGFILLLLYAAGSYLDQVSKGGWRSALRFDRNSPAREVAPLIAVMAASLIAASLNPYGPRLLLYPFNTVSISSLRLYIQEWQSPDFHSPQAQPFAWVLFLSMIALLFSAERKRATEVLALVGIGYLSLLSARNIATFALAAAPGLTRHGAALLARVPLPPQRRELPPALTRAVNGLLIVLVAAGVGLWSLPKLTPEFNSRELGMRMPAEVVQELANSGVEGPLLNSYDWGGYIIWHLWPHYRVYVDGRTDLFGDRILEEYLTLWRAGEGWEGIVAKHGFRVAVLEPSAPITHALQAAGWQVRNSDRLGMLLVAPNGPEEPQ